MAPKQSIDIEVEIKDAEIRGMLSRMNESLVDMTPAMKVIGEILVSSATRNFQAQGRPVRWKPSHRVEASGGQTLSLTGRLRRSLTRSAEKDRAIAGTNVVYASTHQFGAKKGAFGTVVANVAAHVRNTARGKVNVKAHARTQQAPWEDIPARPFLLVQEEDWKEIREALQGFLLGAA